MRETEEGCLSPLTVDALDECVKSAFFKNGELDQTLLAPFEAIEISLIEDPKSETREFGIRVRQKLARSYNFDNTENEHEAIRSDLQRLVQKSINEQWQDMFGWWEFLSVDRRNLQYAVYSNFGKLYGGEDALYIPPDDMKVDLFTFERTHQEDTLSGDVIEVMKPVNFHKNPVRSISLESGQVLVLGKVNKPPVNLSSN